VRRFKVSRVYCVDPFDHSLSLMSMKEDYVLNVLVNVDRGVITLPHKNTLTTLCELTTICHKTNTGTAMDIFITNELKPTHT